jgi:hypothetical protein
MEQALEALESAVRYHGIMLMADPPQAAWKYHRVEDNAKQAITALREALEQQPVQEPSYVGVRMWVGNRHIMQCSTRLEYNHATIGPQRLLELIAGRCIRELSYD